MTSSHRISIVRQSTLRTLLAPLATTAALTACLAWAPSPTWADEDADEAAVQELGAKFEEQQADQDEQIELYAAANASYVLYYYALVPGQKLVVEGNPNARWYGLGQTYISGVPNPNSLSSGTSVTGYTIGDVTKALYPDIVHNGVTYSYAETGSPEAEQAGHYTLQSIEVVASPGANTGANGYNDVVGYGNTYHWNFIMVLTEVDVYTVTYNVLYPGATSYVSDSSKAQRVPAGTAASEVRPGDAAAIDGYTFCGWYLDEECTVPASFDGTIEANTNYYGMYVPSGAVTVTTTGSSATYDGQAHGATVEVAGLPSGYTANASSSATLTCAGTLTASCDELVITNALGVDVTGLLNVVLVDGEITVAPAPLHVATGSDEKTYDGTPLTAGGNVEGLVAGETVGLVLTGSQTEVGSCENGYTLVWGNEDGNYTALASNYTVASESLGTLEVTVEPWIELDIVETVVSEPADGLAYTLGEEVHFRIEISNVGNVALEGVTVSNAVDATYYVPEDVEVAYTVSADGATAFIEGIEPEGSVYVYASYTVGEADVAAGEIVDYATAGTSVTVQLGDTATVYARSRSKAHANVYTVVSNQVSVPTAAAGDEGEEEDEELPGGEEEELPGGGEDESENEELPGGGEDESENENEKLPDGGEGDSEDEGGDDLDANGEDEGDVDQDVSEDGGDSNNGTTGDDAAGDNKDTSDEPAQVVTPTEQPQESASASVPTATSEQADLPKTADPTSGVAGLFAGMGAALSAMGCALAAWRRKAGARR